MIIMGKLSEYSKEFFDDMLNNVDMCYCTEYNMYKYLLSNGIIADMAYLNHDRNGFINNDDTDVEDKNVILPNDSYMEELEILDNEYTVYRIDW